MSRNLTLKYHIPRETIGAPHYGFLYEFSAVSTFSNDPRTQDRNETMVNEGTIWQLRDLLPYMTYTIKVYASSHQGLSFPKTHTFETAPEGKMLVFLFNHL